ncbi:MAG TPA: SDR family NAD(P)-dependent oxidoreductase, partial [Pseudonocardiaceae bacterium]|nr:SDR family NAD(P)-dependent oxidoreductase [Pseudonocardiaceae bacterium]
LLAFDETHGLVNTLHTVQAGIDAPLWLATSGAVSTGRGDSLTSPTQAQVWGLGRVVGLEHADRWGGLVDLPDTVDPVAAQRLVSALAGIADEDQLAIRGNGILARRLVHAPIGDRRPTRTWQPTGTILITGGTGALGAHVARWLATAGADDLILTSRRGPSAPGAAQLVDELAALGATATVVACDMADRAALAKVLTGEPIRAVVHTAGVVQATMLADMGAAELADVLSAKVDGARNLDELLDDDLDAFVLFSSNAGVWGSGGQGAYAAGNAYLDALAQHRRDRGRTATSVAWGAWRGGGMAAHDDAEEQLRRRGVRAMPPEVTLAALRTALDHDETFVAVADVDWARFVPGFTSARRRPLLDELPEVRQALAAEQATPTDQTLARRMATLPPAERDRLVLDLVRGAVGAVLGHSRAEAIDAGRAFKEIGFDSLTSVELRNRLTASTGLKLPATLVFDHPTPAELARFIRSELVDDTPTGADAVLAELDRLDAVVSRISPVDGDFGLIASRLRSMLSRLGDANDSQGVAGVAQQLEAATDDEIFDFIHRELGRS